MVKVYKLHPAGLYFLIIVILVLIICTFIFTDKDKFQYYLGLFLIPFLSMWLVLGILLEVRIDENEILGHYRYLPMKGKKIRYENIKLIDDDHFLYAHAFRIFPHVNPKGNLVEKMRDVGDSVTIGNFYKDYDDLLREILVRCEPGTKVDEIVLRKADMTWEQVEIERRKRWLGKS